MDKEAKMNDRAYPYATDAGSLMAQCLLYSSMALGFSIRSYLQRATYPKGKGSMLASVACLYLCMVKFELLSDLWTHKQKYPELYTEPSST
jgi:hypothetical protein